MEVEMEMEVKVEAILRSTRTCAKLLSGHFLVTSVFLVRSLG